MSFYAKLAAFWVVVYAALWLLSRFPNSRVSRIAFSWHGPIPYRGEYKSHYFGRWCIYALTWFAQILFIFSCGYFVSSLFPHFANATLFLVVWAFALPLLGGTALLGAVLAACASLKAKYVGPNPVFEVLSDESVV
jgi:hypothetical protein